MTLSEVKSEAKASLKGNWKKAILAFIVYSLISSLLSMVLIFIPFIGQIIISILSVPFSVGLMFIFLSIVKGENFKYLDFLHVAMKFFGRSWGIVFSTLLKIWKPLLLFLISLIILVVNVTSMTSSSILSAAQSASDKYYAAQYGVSSITPSIATAKSSSFAPMLSLLSALLTVVSTIWLMVKGLSYSLSYFILLDNPNMNNKSILEKSEYLMAGNRLKLVFLPFSFIGWIILILALATFSEFALIQLIGVLGGIIMGILIYISLLILGIYIQVSTACFYTKLLNEKQ